ncbi:MAG: hypothetical protein ACLT8E_05635 [Akkermansia sp.]
MFNPIPRSSQAFSRRKQELDGDFQAHQPGGELRRQWYPEKRSRASSGAVDGLPSLIVDRYADCSRPDADHRHGHRLPIILNVLEDLLSPRIIVERFPHAGGGGHRPSVRWRAGRSRNPSPPRRERAIHD